MAGSDNKQDAMVNNGRGRFFEMVEEYARRLHEAEAGGPPCARAAASEARGRLCSALSEIYGEALMPLADDYAAKLRDVDFWSGKAKSSALLGPAYEAKGKLEDALSSLEKSCRPKRRRGGF